ncbi:MAG: PEP-CTERM sorting domain-containing protein [Candidatus Eisenbacteria bacterium]|nr:PEP-CTERM sorting domain-containing protein [Candidatus Eisenbacteria bacterium]
MWTDNFKPTLDSHGLNEFRVGFYFDTVDWMFNEYEGWYVDDVLVHDGQAPPIPEPSTWLLLSTGLVGAVPFVRRKFRR